VTRARSLVLEALEGSSEPMSAAAVFAGIGGACDQATVYRALSYLEAKGKAESFVLHCDEHGTERYYSAGSAGHRHWFHCVACHRFVDLGACRLGGLVAELERERGLQVMHHALYLSGLCAACSEASSPAHEAARRAKQNPACAGLE
jgi:Fur family ferric uptake transcriptional regulator